MNRGHEKTEWRRASQLMTLTANMHRKTPLDWDYFYPFKEPPRELTESEKEARICAMFMPSQAKEPVETAKPLAPVADETVKAVLRKMNRRQNDGQ